MAMDAEQLRDELITAFDALVIDEGDPDKAKSDVMFAFADTILAHIKTNAVVPSGITVSVDPNTGAGSTTGPGAVE